MMHCSKGVSINRFICASRSLLLNSRLSNMALEVVSECVDVRVCIMQSCESWAIQARAVSSRHIEKSVPFVATVGL